MTNTLQSVAAPIALLATASGARTMMGVAAVARARVPSAAEQERQGAMPRIVGRFDQRIADAATAMAAFELMADKAPHVPDRTAPGPLFGRVVAGAVVGASVAGMAGVDRQTGAIGGAVVSFIAAQITFRLRAALAQQVPAFVAGLIEDALVVGIAAAGVELLPRGASQAAS
jgi:uncharacterized membrane protein